MHFAMSDETFRVLFSCYYNGAVAFPGPRAVRRKTTRSRAIGPITKFVVGQFLIG